MHETSASQQMMDNSLAAIADIALENDAMTSFTLIGAAAALLLVATPAMARQRAHPYRYGYSHRVSRSAYGAYDFDRGDNFAAGNPYENDFDRKNTFN